MKSNQSVDAVHIGLPSEDIMSSDCGLHQNHEYQDARGWDMEGYIRISQEEDAILEWAAQGNDLRSGEAYERFEDSEAWCTSIDPGVISTVIALSVAGCCPVTSCSGGPGHSGDYPYVFFWCPESSWSNVLDAARRAGVSLEGYEEPGVRVYAEDGIASMRQFAKSLADLYREEDS